MSVDKSKIRKQIVEHGVLGMLCPPYFEHYLDNSYVICVAAEYGERLLVATAPVHDSPERISWSMSCEGCSGLHCFHSEEVPIPAGPDGWLFLTTHDKYPLCTGWT